MTISTYSELKDSVGNWSSFADLGTSGANASRLDEIIDNAEAFINRELRVRDMIQKDSAFSITGEYVNVPVNFGAVKSFMLNASPRTPLLHMADDEQAALYQTSNSAPRFYSIVGAQFRFAPVPSTTQSATLVYYLKVPALTASQTTNWLLTANPDIYMGACQAYAALYKRDFDGFGMWQSMTKGLLDQLKSISRNDETANGMTIRPDVVA